jgi:hypothetical protein
MSWLQDELRVRYETEKNATGAMQLELAATMQQLHVANQQLEAAQQEKQEALAALVSHPDGRQCFDRDQKH